VRYFCPAGSGRRAVSVLVEDGTGRRTIITKGAPEDSWNGVPRFHHRQQPARPISGSRIRAARSRRQQAS